MDTRELQFADKRGKSWTVKVSEATALIGMRRSVMRRAGSDVESGDVAGAVLRTITYPDLVSCVVEAGGFESWPIAYDEFAGLPDQFVVSWETAVYDLNPHWLPSEDDDGDGLKKTANGSIEE